MRYQPNEFANFIKTFTHDIVPYETTVECVSEDEFHLKITNYGFSIFGVVSIFNGTVSLRSLHFEKTINDSDSTDDFRDALFECLLSMGADLDALCLGDVNSELV
jgi:hypothetical protein